MCKSLEGLEDFECAGGPKQPWKHYLIDSLSLALRHRPPFYMVFGA
jgi:hypothetical protein